MAAQEILKSSSVDCQLRQLQSAPLISSKYLDRLDVRSVRNSDGQYWEISIWGTRNSWKVR